MGPRYKCWRGYTMKEKPIELFVSLVQGARNHLRAKMEKKKETLAADINALTENDEKMVRGLIKQVNEKYRKVIYDEYKFPPDLVEGVCLEKKIFTHEKISLEVYYYHYYCCYSHTSAISTTTFLLSLLLLHY
jgi:hypothetical protein